MVFSPTLSFCLKHPSWFSIKCLSKNLIACCWCRTPKKVGNKLNIILLSYSNRYGTTTVLCTDNSLWKARRQWEGRVDVFTNIPITAGREHALPGHIIFCTASQKLSPLESLTLDYKSKVEFLYSENDLTDSLLLPYSRSLCDTVSCLKRTCSGVASRDGLMM